MTLYAMQWLGFVAVLCGLFLAGFSIGWITAHYSARDRGNDLAAILRYIRGCLESDRQHRGLVRYLDRALGEEREA